MLTSPSLQPRRRRGFLLLLAAVVGLLALSTRSSYAQEATTTTQDPPQQVPAGPQIDWATCDDTPGFQCGTLNVPLDYSGLNSGTVPLAVSRIVATDNPSRTAIVALAGGPGQAALPLRIDFQQTLGPALGTRDLLVFDQRGTGSSGRLTCPSAGTVSGCARELGPSRSFYRTVDSVADIEALRQAGGYERLVLYGVSYGTKVAADYASTHPDRVEALVLDSVVLPEGPDIFLRSSLRAAPRVLAELCARGACSGITSAVRSDLRRLATRLLRGPINGITIADNGRRIRAGASQSALIEILLAGDFNPTLRAELPGSMRAALTGDPAPLLRLARRASGITSGTQSLAQADSNALYLATVCEDARLPWNRAAAPQQRLRTALQAALATPKSQRGPFSTRAMLDISLVSTCISWPSVTPEPVATALPTVPTLVLSGSMDLRTPIEDAVQIAERIPGTRITRVPYVSHSVLGSEGAQCATDAVAAFFAGAPHTACDIGTNAYMPTPRPPKSLRYVRPLGRSGIAGRVARTALMTVTDARRQLLGEILAQGRVPQSVGGLRSGSVAAARSGDALVMQLRGYSYVSGVQLSGRWSTASGGLLRVRGAVRGTVRISRRGALDGTLDGRRIHIAAASDRSSTAATGDAELPSLRSALQSGRRRAALRSTAPAAQAMPSDDRASE